jgi:very-short-patch-repair endonuclease
LIVEVDGEIHYLPEEAECDGGRPHDLQERGFLVVRYSNEAVLNQLPKVTSGHRATFEVASGGEDTR